MADSAFQIQNTDQTARCVLLVDDNPLMLRCLKRALAHCPRPIVTCSSPSEALKEVTAGHVEVVVSDIVMPEMSGLDLLRRVHDIDMDLPVILLTGVPCVDTAASAVENGAFSYLLKPIGTDVLLRNIVRAIQTYSDARERHSEPRRGPSRSSAAFRSAFDDALSSLWLAYQPIVRASDCTVFGYEGLVRTGHSAMAEPESILGAAERLASMNQLGRCIRRYAARDLVYAPASMSFFVNLHPQDLCDEEIFQADSPLATLARRVVLEITERAALSSIEGLHPRIDRLRKLGFRIAVDDLGAGYSGLNNVAALEPEFIKLDMSLVRGLDTSVTKQRIVSSMISLAAALGASVIAEGVETQTECAVLLELGCNLLQGFLFGKPEQRFNSEAFECMPESGSSAVPCVVETDQALSGVHRIQPSVK